MGKWRLQETSEAWVGTQAAGGHEASSNPMLTLNDWCGRARKFDRILVAARPSFRPTPSHQVKQEVWDALLKRYGYQEVTDMLAMMHSASVIRRAVAAMRRRKWTRNFARIDPELVEKADWLRRIQVDVCL